MNESRQQLRNRLELLEDIRCWLLDRIDGSEETKGDDGLISDFIRKLDALSSEMGTIPDAERKKVMTAHMLAESIVERATVETPITDAVVKMMEAGWLSLGSSAPGAVKPLIETMELMERELIDVKQRLLPQYVGRAERAQRERQMISHERDSLLEKLRAATTMPCAPSATAAPVAWCVGYDDPRMGRIHSDPTMHKPQAEALAERNGLALVSLYAGSLPVEEEAIGHARYEYLRTLNPRQFAALYNEALMGVHQFDDLVDRYRDAGERNDG